MNNCLKTQLKGSADNDNLPKYDCFYFNVHSMSGSATSDKFKFRVGGSSMRTIKIIGDGYMWTNAADWGDVSKGVKTLQITAAWIYFSNGDYTVEVGGRSDIDRISSDDAANFSISDISYIPELTQFSLKDSIKSTFSFDDLMGYNLTNNNINLRNCANMAGTTESIRENLLIEQVNIGNCISLTGSIADFGKWTSLVVIHVAGAPINKDITLLAAAQVSNGRTSGTIDCHGTTGGDTIRFGSSMVNPTQEETTRGWQVA